MSDSTNSSVTTYSNWFYSFLPEVTNLFVVALILQAAFVSIVIPC
jgi:hypothetical protein